MTRAQPEATTMDLVVTVNGSRHEVQVDPQMPILWLLRDFLGLTGTKYGCGEGQCGACTVHVDGKVQRACCTPCKDVAGSHVVTIEGLSKTGDHPLQRAWVEQAVPQCGFCQAGQIMTAAALLEKHPLPSVAQIQQSLAGNLCRCGTYTRIIAAIQEAAKANAPVQVSAAGAPEQAVAAKGESR